MMIDATMPPALIGTSRMSGFVAKLEMASTASLNSSVEGSDAAASTSGGGGTTIVTAGAARGVAERTQGSRVGGATKAACATAMKQRRRARRGSIERPRSAWPHVAICDAPDRA